MAASLLMNKLFRILFVLSLMAGLNVFSMAQGKGSKQKDTKTSAEKASADKNAQNPVESASNQPAQEQESKDPLQYYRFRTLARQLVADA